jgi:hypothetical protein
MNNMAIVNHQNIFIYIDNGYPRSYHDVTILWHFDIYINWCNHFAHANDYFEYCLGTQATWANKCLACNKLDNDSCFLDADFTMVFIYNKMHAIYRVKVEGGIRGFKSKCWRLMKFFDTNKSTFCHFISYCCPTYKVSLKTKDGFHLWSHWETNGKPSWFWMGWRFISIRSR